MAPEYEALTLCGMRPTKPPPKPRHKMAEPQERRPTKLRAWRKHAGMTLEEAAGEAGMSVGNLSAMERGKQGYSDHMLAALGRVYRALPGWLLDVDPQADILPLWERATPEQRVQILAAAMKAFLNIEQ